MQNSYVGDITDFFKFLILRKLNEISTFPLAINWYVPHQKTVSKEKGTDGKKLSWIGDKSIEVLDNHLFSELSKIANSPNRNLESFEKSKILHSDTLFYGEEIPLSNKDSKTDRELRKKWFEVFLNKIESHNFIFLDPDNGFKIDDRRYKPSQKHVLDNEILELYNKGKSIILINFRDRSPSEKYDDKLYSIANLIGKPIPIHSIRVRKNGFKDFIFIPQPKDIEVFEKLYTEIVKDNNFFEIVGISSGKFFTRDTFYLVPVKTEELNSRRFSENEQIEFDNFYDDEFCDIEVKTYQDLLKDTIDKVNNIEGLSLEKNEKSKEELEYHIMKAIKIFTIRYFNL